MSDRHFYKSVETGLVTEMDDDVAAVFGDSQERVTRREAEDLPRVGDPVVESVPEQRARTSRGTSVDDEEAE